MRGPRRAGREQPHRPRRHHRPQRREAPRLPLHGRRLLGHRARLRAVRVLVTGAAGHARARPRAPPGRAPRGDGRRPRGRRHRPGRGRAPASRDCPPRGRLPPRGLDRRRRAPRSARTRPRAVNGDGARQRGRAPPREAGRGARGALDGLRLRRRARARLRRGRRARRRSAPTGAPSSPASGRRAAAHPGGARIARTAWLYGADGRNFVDTMRAARAPSATRWPWWTTRRARPTWTRDLAPGARGPAGRCRRAMYHTAGGGSVTWAGPRRGRSSTRPALDCRVRPHHHRRARAPRAAPGAVGRCAVTRPGAPRLRPWREALADYLRGERREAAGHRRLRVHRLGVRAPGPRRAGPRWSTSTSSPTPATRPTSPTWPTTTAYRFVHGDIADADGRGRGRSRACDAVVNFAAESHVDRSILDPADFIRTDVRRHRRRCSTPPAGRAWARFVQVSTDEVYGSIADRAPSGRPTRSARPARTRPARPAATCRCSRGTAPSALDAVITRGSNTFGPRQYPEKLIPLFVTNALDGLAAAGLRRRHAGARLDPRRRPLRGHLDGPGARAWPARSTTSAAATRCRTSRSPAASWRSPARDASLIRHVDGPPRPRPPLRARHRASCARLGWEPRRDVRGGAGRDRRAGTATAATGGSRSRAASTARYYEEQYGGR